MCFQASSPGPAQDEVQTRRSRRSNSEKFPVTASVALGGREATAQKSRPTCFRGNSLGARSSWAERKPKSESRDSGRSTQARPRGFPGGRPLRRGYRPLAPCRLQEGDSRTLLKVLENLPHPPPSFLSSGGLEMSGFFSPSLLYLHSLHTG